MCKCSVCNSTYNLNEFENCNIRDIMLSKDMCFNCAFWQEKVDLANENTIVVDGYRYQCSLVDKNIVKGFLGCGGVDRYFQMLNNPNDVRHYNNCWCQGKVPDLWKDKIPNNAISISNEEYYTIKEGNSKIGQYLIFCCGDEKENEFFFKRKIKKNSIDTFNYFLRKNKDKYKKIYAFLENPENKNFILTCYYSYLLYKKFILYKNLNSVSKELYNKTIKYYNSIKYNYD